MWASAQSLIVSTSVVQIQLNFKQRKILQNFDFPWEHNHISLEVETFLKYWKHPFDYTHKNWTSQVSNFWNYVKTRKSTGFKSLRVSCWELNQLAWKCLILLLEKTCKKRSKTKKCHHRILSSWNSVGTKF